MRAIAIQLAVALIGLSAASTIFAAGPTTAPAPREKYRTFAMVHQGDAEAGKALFGQPGKIACAQCHTVDGKGGKAGPDLFAIGDKYGRADLIEQVLEPSASIAVGYSTTIIRTKAGDLFTGIIKEANDQVVGLMGADGKLNRIKTSDIDRQRTEDTSLMPEGLEQTVTQQQLADLISYLTTLKAQQSNAVEFHGMPLEIPKLKTPLGLTQINSDANKFAHPVWFGFVPGLADAYTVVEHETGTIWLFTKHGSEESKTVFLKTARVQSGTRGLLSMIFHPKFVENHKYYVVRHTTDGKGFATHIQQGLASTDFKSDSGEPLKEILTIHSIGNGHYGGSLAFGPDGDLYIGMGDAGPQGDPEGHGQNLSLLQGKILRIDVDHPAAGKGYSIPKDNPFLNRVGARPEIWTYGHREPWRISFDPVTGDLWEGEVGQDLYEEVNIIHKGENYGWNVYEGFERYSNKYRKEGEKFVPPVFSYTRKYGASCTGGFVYRADPKSSFYGVYVFGDYQKKKIFAMTQKDRVLDQVRLLAEPPQMPVSFGQDAAGNIYFVGYEGNIYKLELESAKFE